MNQPNASSLPQREMKKKITWNAANIEEILHFQTEAPVYWALDAQHLGLRLGVCKKAYTGPPLAKAKPRKCKRDPD